MGLQLTTVLIAAGAGAVVLFIWSGIAWMALPHHKGDFHPLADRSDIEAALAAANANPGMYCIPHMDEFEQGLKDPALAERMQSGPNAMVVVMPKGPPMTGATFVRSFALNLFEALACVMLLNLVGEHVPTLADKVVLFALVGLFNGVSSYCSMSNWMCLPWRFAWTNVFDNVLGFALVGVVLHYVM